jgi:MFS transporter, MCT family, solute carrier family 16 (monocarboxylic acid transporters), member 14
VKPEACPTAFVPVPPDGGFGWVIVAAAFMNNLIIDGIGYSYGVLMVELLNSFDTNKAKVSMIGALLCGVYLASGPIGGALVNRYDCRITTFIGSIISCVAFFISSFSPTIDMLLVFFGVFGGFGFGLIFLPSIIIVSHYFDKRRSTAVGIATCGTGFGAFIGAPFLNLLLEVYDWSNAVRILAGLLLNCAVFGALMRPLKAEKQVVVSAKSETIGLCKPKVEVSVANQHEIEIKVSTVDMSEHIANYPTHNIESETTGDKPSQTGKHTSTKGNKLERSFSRSSSAINQDSGVSSAEETSNFWMSVPIIGDENAKNRRSNKKQTQLESNNNNQNAPFLLPPGVNREDYALPMYRKDIFYSGSVANLGSDQKLGQSHGSLLPKHPTPPLVGTDMLALTQIPTENVETKTQKCRFVPKLVRDIFKEMTDFSLLRHPGFLLIFISSAANIGYWVPSFYLPDLAKFHNISSQQGAILLSLMGVANMVARFTFNALANLSFCSPLFINNITLLLSGLITFLIPLLTTFPLLLAYAIAYGVLVAANVSLASPILCNLVGIEKLTNAFGLIGLARGISSFIGPPLAGVTYDLTGSHVAPFMLGAVTIVLSAVLFFLVHIPRFQKPHSKE